MGTIHRAKINNVEIRRTLAVIINPQRYRSKAAEAFTQEILPLFATKEEYKEIESFYQEPARYKTMLSAALEG
jgi:hypothetical protein